MSDAALPTLRTPRLTLRPLRDTDADAVHNGVSNFDVIRWLGRIPYPYGREDAVQFIARATRGELRAWAVEDGDGFVGVAGLDEELGYWLARPAWGKGYGFEAAHAVVAHWFSDPANGDIESGHYNGNDRSRRILLALGFRPVRERPRFARALSQDVMGTDLVLTRAAWEARQDFRIESKRLIIRPLEDRDASDFARLTVPEVTTMLSNLKTGMTKAEALADFPRRKWRGHLRFTLAIEHERKMIGTIGIGVGDIGYFLAPTHWGRGLMAEALACVLPAIFEKFPISRIEAGHFEDNPVSGHLLRKIGFEETGREMATSLARLEPAPLITYALTREKLRVSS